MQSWSKARTENCRNRLACVVTAEVVGSSPIQVAKQTTQNPGTSRGFLVSITSAATARAAARHRAAGSLACRLARSPGSLPA